MKIKYIYSACQEITTDSGFTLLLDPWFKDGAFHGSWCLAYEPAPLSRKPDAVWVSHIHPDHYCPSTLRDLGVDRVHLSHGSAFLERAMKRDGFTSDPLPDGWHRLAVDLEVRAMQYDDIDSVILVRSNGKTVLFYVDTPSDDAFIARILEAAGGKVDLAYLPYAGGGPWPQCFEMTVKRCKEEAGKKTEKLLATTVGLWEKLGKPWMSIYAGEYVLGGRLAYLNTFLGTPTRAEAHDRLEAAGCSLVRIAPGDSLTVGDSVYCDVWGWIVYRRPPAISYAYDNKFSSIAAGSLPLPRLVRACHRNLEVAKARFSREDIEKIERWTFYFLIDGTEFRIPTVNEAEEIGPGRVEIHVTLEMFLSAALGITHWNNLEVGSHLYFKRTPDEYCRPLHRLLSFFHI